MSVSWWLSLAAAQGLATHHPVVPSAGIAHENGPGALWVNPANIAYDPDFRYGLFVSQPLVPTEGAAAALPSSAGLTVGVQGANLGIHNVLREAVDGEVLSDWSVDYATSLLLPERIAVGLLMSWNFIDTGPNYFAYDAGASWRPLPWLGVGGSAQNIGAPDPSQLALPRSGVGVAVRPVGRAALVGADWVRVFDPVDGDDQDLLLATARVRPLEGLYVRGNVTMDATTGPTLLGAGAGVELYFGGAGVGWHGDVDSAGGLLQTVMLGSDEPGESLIPSRRQVPTLAMAERPAYQPRPGLFTVREPSWLDTLERLRRLEDDPGVRGLVLHLDGPALSMALATELRDRVHSLEAAGKRVTVYLDGSSSNSVYYVASAASDVFMHPAGELHMIGLAAQLQTARGLLDWVGVQPQFVKQGKYKSAPEQFTHIEPSEAALEQTHALLDDLFAQLVSGIADGRNVDATTVEGWIDDGPWPAEVALERGLVDRLVYPDELDDVLEGLHDGPVRRSELADRPEPRSPWEDPQQIAVIYIEGGITDGPSSRGGLLSGRSTGSDTIVRQLDQAREDPQVRAVVLRVDSPGGSAFASEEIWRAIARFEAVEKPVVVSMGSVAASGGYYVAAGADAIWAEPGTITGSIGVYSGKFATGDLLERLGVRTTTTARGRNATLDSSVTPWDDRQRQRMQDMVDHTYDLFKRRVADGRDLPADDVQRVAQGRVWSGVAAREAGLVDNLGGFEHAIRDARERAGIPEKRKVGLVEYGDGGTVFESLAPSVTAQLFGPFVRRAARSDAPAFDALFEDLRPIWLQLQQPEGTVWAMDPFTLTIEGTE